MNAIGKYTTGEALRQSYDLAVVGGGIYGAMLLYEAHKRGLTGILVERDDFGQHTSFNWLRILHGGLRYLQTLDLRRFRESVAERRWFLKTFPGHIHLLPCLMPLYHRGIRRPAVFRAALQFNDLLSRQRNNGIMIDRLKIPDGQVIAPNKVKALFPMVDCRGLAGGAVWYDAIVPDSQRIVIDLLRTACRRKCVALNYMEARRILISNQGSIRGITAYDRIRNAEVEIAAPIVINAAGPWCREVAHRMHRDMPELFYPSIAWNFLFDRPGLSSHALAVSPPWKGGHTYFLVTWKDRLLVGTGHKPWMGDPTSDPLPSNAQIQTFVDDLNSAVPGLNLDEREIDHIFSGLLPVIEPETDRLSKRPLIVDHGAQNSRPGLYSVSGVKFTTARLVAEQLLTKIFGPAGNDLPQENEPIPPSGQINALFEMISTDETPSTEISQQLKQVADREAVTCSEDLLVRRLGLVASVIDKDPSLASLRFCLQDFNRTCGASN